MARWERQHNYCRVTIVISSNTSNSGMCRGRKLAIVDTDLAMLLGTQLRERVWIDAAD